MPNIDITQSEAYDLIKMEKVKTSSEIYDFPAPGDYLKVLLKSKTGIESFILDVNRQKIELGKITYQTRAREVIILLRLDCNGSTHRNPDNEEIPCPHMHIYKEGFGYKWAYPISTEDFSNIDNLWKTLFDFMKYCNITDKPNITKGLYI